MNRCLSRETPNGLAFARAFPCHSGSVPGRKADGRRFAASALNRSESQRGNYFGSPLFPVSTEE